MIILLHFYIIINRYSNVSIWYNKNLKYFGVLYKYKLIIYKILNKIKYNDNTKNGDVNEKKDIFYYIYN